MNIERLKLMSAMLGEVIAGTWKSSAGVPGVPQNGEFDITSWVAPDSCGFHACAVGHALLDARFNQQGLVAEEFGDIGSLAGFMPSYEGNKHWEAVDAFFGTSYPVSRPLFSGEYYETEGGTGAAQVKARVDFLIGLTIENPEWGHGGKPFYAYLREADL